MWKSQLKVGGKTSLYLPENLDIEGIDVCCDDARKELVILFDKVWGKEHMLIQRERPLDTLNCKQLYSWARSQRFKYSKFLNKKENMLESVHRGRDANTLERMVRELRTGMEDIMRKWKKCLGVRNPYDVLR